MSENLNIIQTRRNSQLANKDDIYKLIYDSYKGGQTYLDGNHLWDLSTKESPAEYEERKRRAIYINLIKPIVSLLASKIYSNEQVREYPESIDYIEDNVCGGIGIEQYMRGVAEYSCLFTIGVLCDAPGADALENVTSKRQQYDNRLFPYVKKYFPWQIRDFSQDKQNQLEWVLLDDSYFDTSNPLSKGVERTIYTLWTKTEFIKYEITGGVSGQGKRSVNEIGRGQHNIGYVPFKFVTWEDYENDKIADTPFEDAAIISRQIFNVMSYLDEMIAAGTFKHLFYPAPSAKEIPESFKKNGISGAVVTFYNSEYGTPMYVGADMQSVEPFLRAIEFYENKIAAIFGMDEDRDKKMVQSGVAKDLEFSKSETMLTSAATNLEYTEEWILKTLSRWHTDIPESEIDKIDITYNKDFRGQEIDAELARLFQITMTPYEKANQYAWSEIITKVLSNVEDDRIKEILKEIFPTELEKTRDPVAGEFTGDNAESDGEQSGENASMR